MKMSLGARVYVIAEKYNIEQVKVHTIINSYISYCKDLLLSGHKVDIFGLASITPDVIIDEYATTLAYDCKLISKDLYLPSHTVYVIVQEYINSLIDNILSGKEVDVRGLFSVHPLSSLENDKVTKIHTAISSQLKIKLGTMDTPVTSVRVHTHKLLKYAINN